MLPPLRAPFKKKLRPRFLDWNKSPEELEELDEEEEEDPDFEKKRAAYKKRLKSDSNEKKAIQLRRKLKAPYNPNLSSEIKIALTKFPKEEFIMAREVGFVLEDIL